MTLLAVVRTGRSPGPLGLLAVVVLCGALVTSLRRGPEEAAADCVGMDGFPCERPARTIGTLRASPVVGRDRACADAAYLCEGLSERGPLRVMRWDGATSEIRVLVPLPEHEDPSVARQLQQAAARGIRAWDRHPFPIRIELRERPGVAADITVRWTRRLGTTELGVASTQWGPRDGRLTMTVEDFALSTRSPFDGGVVLPARQVELTAAHEMGHALGLPHSGEARDVMHPTNTASALSARDYRAMETLYGLENGAEIR